MIIYFSGTGNSRYVANILGEQLNEQVVDSASLIKKGEKVHSLAQSFIFVSPVYAWRMPKVFERFIEDSKLKGKAYFILTCGSSIGNSKKYIKKLCLRTGLELMGVRGIVAPENYIAMFSAPNEQKAKEILAKTKHKAEQIAIEIACGEPLKSKRVWLLGRFLSSAMNKGFYGYSVSAKKFFATDKCISCGKCAQLCVLNNIKIIDGKPKWSDNCTHCMACISNCPTLAIEYGNKTKKKNRYVCPYTK